MTGRDLPTDFAAMLTRRGRRILDGADPVAGALGRDGRRFLALGDVIEPLAARRCLEVLERAFATAGVLRRMEQPIPPETTWAMREDYSEQLPKAARVWTAMLESRRARAYRIAEDVGLIALLRSASFRQFAEVLNGRPLRRGWGIQLLCYGAGDYSGPHNDHHPEDPDARDGYLDVHLSFVNAAVSRQLLVYERRGHFTEVADVKSVGGVTAYRLPFWHYTTPLEAKPRRTDARRWVLLGTFLDAARPAPQSGTRLRGAASQVGP